MEYQVFPHSGRLGVEKMDYIMSASVFFSFCFFALMEQLLKVSRSLSA